VQILGRLLRRLGLTAKSVNSGEDAVGEVSAALALGTPFLAIMMDIHMPGGMCRSYQQYPTLPPDCAFSSALGLINEHFFFPAKFDCSNPLRCEPCFAWGRDMVFPPVVQKGSLLR
jgi:hypothetical protein